MAKLLEYILPVFLLCASSLRSACSYQTPPPIFEASQYTSWYGMFESSRVADIHVPFKTADGGSDSVFLKRVDLIGDEYARGRAHGALLAMEIAEFIKVIVLCT